MNRQTMGNRTLSWMTMASCQGMDTEMFFPAPGMNVSDEVKALCASCPVNSPCYEYAVKHNLDVGVFAGTSGIERVRARRRRKRASS
jgi:predicted TIM-barrel enzyme